MVESVEVCVGSLLLRRLTVNISISQLSELSHLVRSTWERFVPVRKCRERV